jgi:hypothetical protein
LARTTFCSRVVMDSLRLAARIPASVYVLRATAQQHEKPTTVRFSPGHCRSEFEQCAPGLQTIG